MSGHFPSLDQKTLERLRALVKHMQSENGSGMQMPHLLKLANNFSKDTGLTVDLDAVKDLGQPMLIIRVTAQKKYPDWAHHLSPREYEVAGLAAAGLSNKKIAERLFISLSTVKDHVHSVLTKSGLPSRGALAAQWPCDDSHH